MKKIRLYVICSLLSLAVTILTYCKPKLVFDETAKSRYEASCQGLVETLTSAPNGWRMIYFSRVDSLLFTSIKNTVGDYEYSSRYGYGGHAYLLKFKKNGALHLLSDEDDRSEKDVLISSYKVTQSSTTTLSFDSYTDIHRLIKNSFRGNANFIYQGKNMKGALLFKTVTYANAGCEYICLEPLKNNNWIENYNKAKYNRKFFEEMINPQLKISYGIKEYFKSDYYVKNLEGQALETNGKNVKMMLEHRYYAFLYNKNKILELPDKNNYEILGSGYVGTSEGLQFRPGFYLNSKLRFRDFKREGDRFISELVRVYDPRIKKEFVESKHIYPEGVDLFYRAEIWDEKSKTK